MVKIEPYTNNNTLYKQAQLTKVSNFLSSTFSCCKNGNYLWAETQYHWKH